MGPPPVAHLLSAAPILSYFEVGLRLLVFLAVNQGFRSFDKSSGYFLAITIRAEEVRGYFLWWIHCCAKSELEDLTQQKNAKFRLKLFAITIIYLLTQILLLIVLNTP